MMATKRPPGKPRVAEERKKAQATVVFPDPEDLERLETIARRRRLSLSALMRTVLAEYADNELDASRERRS